MTACDANIVVRAATTSCAFAQNVFYGMWKAQDEGDAAFRAYSPVTRETYAMSCTTGTAVVCKAGDGGEARFPMSALLSYTAADAARYERTHDTGPADSSGSDEPDEPTDNGDDSGGDECDSNYEGACLDPNSPDYDCAGGSGDGPDYTGTVRVAGNDPHDLDRDGDGIACDT
jgi:hypothetical protein